MVRKLRITLAGLPHHVTERGNGRHPVFFTPEDRTVFLQLFATAAATYGVSLLGYCLMTNHVHLIVTPHAEQALGQVCQKTFGQYSAMINTRMHSPGHLWQQRYHSCLLDDVHLWRALRYVERNPVRARMVAHPGEYPWSSAAAHLGGADPTGLLDLESWRELWPGTTWACHEYVEWRTASGSPRPTPTRHSSGSTPRSGARWAMRPSSPGSKRRAAGRCPADPADAPNARGRR
jgi:putative transposase